MSDIKKMINDTIESETRYLAEAILDEIRSRGAPEEIYDKYTLEAWAEEHDFVHRDNIERQYGNHKDEE